MLRVSDADSTLDNGLLAVAQISPPHNATRDNLGAIIPMSIHGEIKA